MPGKRACPVREGGDGKGPKGAPRRRPTSPDRRLLLRGDHMRAGEHMRIGAQQHRAYQHRVCATVDAYLPSGPLRRPAVTTTIITLHGLREPALSRSQIVVAAAAMAVSARTRRLVSRRAGPAARLLPTRLRRRQPAGRDHRQHRLQLLGAVTIPPVSRAARCAPHTLSTSTRAIPFSPARTA